MPRASLRATGRMSRATATSAPSIPQPSQMSMWSPADFPARTSALPEAAQAWLESNQDSGTSSTVFYATVAQDGSLSKMSLACSHPPRGGTLPSYWPDLPGGYKAFLVEAGATQASPEAHSTRSPGGCWTLNMPEFHSDAVASSLSDILVPTEDVPPTFYLSARGCRGILRRSAMRGRTLPDYLREALETAAALGVGSTSLPRLSRRRHVPEADTAPTWRRRDAAKRMA